MNMQTKFINIKEYLDNLDTESLRLLLLEYKNVYSNSHTPFLEIPSDFLENILSNFFSKKLDSNLNRTLFSYEDIEDFFVLVKIVVIKKFINNEL